MGSKAPQSVESMTLRVPFTTVPVAAVGDSVAVSVPVAPARQLYRRDWYCRQ